MTRTLVSLALAGVLVAPAWIRLENGRADRQVLLMIALALLPTVAVALRRDRFVIGFAVGASALVAASAAMQVSLSDARPLDSERDFVVPLLSALHEGFLAYYDTSLPFNPVDFPLMHGLVLVAIYGFTALVGMLVAARRAIAAAGALVVAVGWPATIVPEEWTLGAGTLALAGVLALLFVLRGDEGRVRGLAQAAAVGFILITIATIASSSDAVAKEGFVEWQRWDLYDRPEDPVAVSYVWDSQYQGLEWPKEKTVVLKVRVPGERRSLYWRATTLDEYNGSDWNESLEFVSRPEPREEVDVAAVDRLLPDGARNERDWMRQDVKVEALSDSHLIGSAQPVKWETGTSSPVRLASNGSVLVQNGLRQGNRYTAWAYVPDANPSELARAPSRYPAELERYLRIGVGEDAPALPPYGATGRAEAVRLALSAESPYVADAHEQVYQLAARLTRGARSPYDAAATVEAWFRGVDGGFTYDETPPGYTGRPPLPAFILDHKRGYCQHFAGGMALMLRLLGIPARVAAGFTSGTYNEENKEWTVTDHNAHTWVEVYFPGFGWMPFDPTPNRGILTAPYTAFSPNFNARDALGVLGSAARQEEIRSRIEGVTRPGQEGAEGFSPGEESRAGRDRARDAGPSLLFLVSLVLAAGAAAIVGVKAVRRQVRFATRDPRAVAAACRRDLVGFLADQGVEASPSATFGELGEIVHREFGVDARALMRALAEARYGPPSTIRYAVRRARPELRRLRRRISAQLALGQRVRGALSLRSLAV